MSGADGGTRLTPAEKEIARKLTYLNEEERKRYEARITLATDSLVTVTDQYRLGVVNTLLQRLPERDQGIQLGDHFRAEKQRSYENDQRTEREADKAQRKARAASHKPAPPPAKEPEPPARANDNRYIRSQHEKEKPPGLREGMEPHGSEYSDLARTHEYVAAVQRKVAGQSAAVDAPKPEASQRPRTIQEYLERQRQGRAGRLAEGPQRPDVSPAPVHEAEGKKTAQQEAGKNPTPQPEAPQRPETMQEYVEMHQQRRDQRMLQKAAQRPNALSRSQEPPAPVREADDRKTTQQEAAKAPTEQPKWARRPLTKAELLLQEEVQAARAQKTEQRPNALPRSKELPAHDREAEDKKAAQQEAAKKPTQQPRTQQEYLEMQQQRRDGRKERAAQRRAAGEVTQQQGQREKKQRGPTLGRGRWR
jgi:hypothetical protein